MLVILHTKYTEMETYSDELGREHKANSDAGHEKYGDECHHTSMELDTFDTHSQYRLKRDQNEDT
jgi:hypothetical protein